MLWIPSLNTRYMSRRLSGVSLRQNQRSRRGRFRTRSRVLRTSPSPNCEILRITFCSVSWFRIHGPDDVAERLSMILPGGLPDMRQAFSVAPAGSAPALAGNFGHHRDARQAGSDIVMKVHGDPVSGPFKLDHPVEPVPVPRAIDGRRPAGRSRTAMNHHRAQTGGSMVNENVRGRPGLQTPSPLRPITLNGSSFREEGVCTGLPVLISGCDQSLSNPSRRYRYLTFRSSV